MNYAIHAGKPKASILAVLHCAGGYSEQLRELKRGLEDFQQSVRVGEEQSYWQLTTCSLHMLEACIRVSEKPGAYAIKADFARGDLLNAVANFVVMAESPNFAKDGYFEYVVNNMLRSTKVLVRALEKETA